MKKNYALLLLSCILFHPLFSQEYLAPSPDASALMRQANIGVNYYTGSPVVSIPLAQLSGRELGVSASLFYNSAGNRVQDVASSEGLGWSLSAGGLITRIVRGTPDDLTNGFCTAGKTDPEPDLFFFSFMGRSGKFVLDAYGFPAIYPFQDLVIKPGVCRSTPQTWEIIDENGTRYLFGETLSSRETTTAKQTTTGTTTNYISTWHLSKVVSPNGTDEMTFSYSSSTINYVNYFFTREDGECVSSNNVKDESMKMTVNTKYISSIATSGGYMYFSWKSDRQDIAGGRYLGDIRVNNRSGNQVSKVRFEYSYFQSSGCSTELCKRLRLDKIYDLSSAPLYVFQYNTAVNLPARNSKHFDHWGYYNNNSVDSWIPADPSVGLSGASRAPDAIKMQANLLNKIDERDGSYQLFTYEANKGMKDGQTHIISGSRVKGIETGDGKGNKYYKNYNYTKSGSSITSGILFRLPMYSVYYGNSTQLIVMRRYSHAYSELLDINGAAVGYSRVEEVSPGNGKVVYTFTDYDTNPDDVNSGGSSSAAPPFASTSSRFWERGNPLTISIYTEQNQPVSEEIYEYTFDHPSKKEVIGQKSLTLSYKTNYCGKGNASVSSTYKIISRPFTVKKKTSTVFDQNNPTKKSTLVSEFAYDPTTYQLVNVTNYNSALPNEKYITKYKYITHSDYSFNRSAYCQNQRTQCLTGCGSSTYCYDQCEYVFNSCMNSGDPREKAISLMRSRHMNNVLVEEQSWFQKSPANRLLGANLNTFGLHPQNSAIIIQTASMISEKVSGTFNGSSINTSGSFTIPSQFKTVLSFNSYDATTGKLLQATGRDGLQTQSVWDHNGTLVKTSTTVGGILQQATNYEYKPLVGITKETDMNGLSAYTEYDALSRIHLTKDSDNNIISRYRYHFKGETASFILSANKLQANPNESILFSVSDVFASTGGSTTISWNMGDGRTYTDNRQSVSLSYPTAGNYTVSATLNSTEYAPVTKSLTIKINQPLQVKVCVDGPYVIDVCTNQVMAYGTCTASNNTPYSNIELIATPVAGSGCTGNYSYKWESKLVSSSYWSTFGSTQRAIFNRPSQPGPYLIRCTVTDACGKTAIGEENVTFFQGQPNCSGGYMPLSIQQHNTEDGVFPEQEGGFEDYAETVSDEEEGQPLPIPTGIPYGVFATFDEIEETDSK